VAAPMESVADHVRHGFDVAFVYAAFHHAFDWRRTLNSVSSTLRPGGWFLICNEPNVLHTAISYRVAKLSNTHEVGFSRSELVRELRRSGFADVRIFQNHFHLWIREHWLAARKPT
jgi:hypothetical protein